MMRDETLESIIVCGWCQKEFERNQSKFVTNAQKYCSPFCRSRAGNELANSKVSTRECEVCGVEWRTHKQNAYACSPICAETRKAGDTRKVRIWHCAECNLLCVRVGKNAFLDSEEKKCLLCRRGNTVQQREPRGSGYSKLRERPDVIRREVIETKVKCKTCKHGQACHDSDIGWRCSLNAMVCKPLHLATLYQRGRK